MSAKGLVINKDIARRIQTQIEVGILTEFEILINTDKKVVLKDELGITIYEKLIHDENVKVITLYQEDLDIILSLI